LIVYLDTSFVASLFVVDAHTQRAVAWLRRGVRQITFSDWTLAEFTSALATANRAGRLPPAMRAVAERELDRWVDQPAGTVLAVLPEDVRQARALINSTSEALRAPDALHLAVASRNGAALATFDVGMARAAADLGLTVEDL
jgi:uncharacterized protein